jgi:hypothetical protein
MEPDQVSNSILYKVGAALARSAADPFMRVNERICTYVSLG